jgi:hypothetical protein
LTISPNNLLEIDNFEDDPLILKPFEVFQKQYDPVAYYDVATNRMDINELLRDRKAKKAIVLSTSSGKHEVTGNIMKWDAMVDFFKNYFTVVIKPMRLYHRGVSYGSNVRYLVDITRNDETHQVISIQEDDYMLKKFESFQLTKEALRDTGSLKEFFEEQKRLGTLGYESLRIIDFQKELQAAYNYPNLKTIESERYGTWKYRFLGGLITKRERRKDRKAQRARKSHGPHNKLKPTL